MLTCSLPGHCSAKSLSHCDLLPSFDNNENNENNENESEDPTATADSLPGVPANKKRSSATARRKLTEQATKTKTAKMEEEERKKDLADLLVSAGKALENNASASSQGTEVQIVQLQHAQEDLAAKVDSMQTTINGISGQLGTLVSIMQQQQQQQNPS